MVEESEIETTMLSLVAQRGVDKTICPSEVARALGAPSPEDWRGLMGPVRRVAVRLAAEGMVAILRGGAPIANPETMTGIYRLGMPREAGD